MSLNWKEIDLILSELDLPGCHVQGVHQPDYRTLILELYRPGNPFRLLISLAQGGVRLHRTIHKPQKPRVIPRFAEFLRSRIRGGRITAAAQLGSERIIRIEIVRADETTLLWIRLWGGAGNILATDADGTVLDAFFRRPGRGEISGENFDPEALISRAQERSSDSAPRQFEVRELQGAGDFNDRVATFYRERENRAERERLREKLARALIERESRLRAALERLREREDDYSLSSDQKLYGDLIMSNLHRIQRGDEWLEAENYEEDNRPVRIQLNPTLSPSANAEHYYDLHKKARSGLGLVRAEITGVEAALLAVEREAAELRETDDTVVLRQKWKETDRRATSSGGDTSGEGRPGLEFRSGPFRIIVGRSANENDRLLRRYARGNDVWLHTRDYPGAYVFVKMIPGKSIPLDTLLDAGNLAVFYSKARSSGYAELYYTKVKYLRRPREGKKGLVLPTQERNLSVKLDPVRLRRLQMGRDQA
jgi:predicted ribosome quality control (RQC) complex YloA/Tae2 family protein